MSARKSLQSAQESSKEQPFVWLFLCPAEVDHLCHPYEAFAAQRDFLISIGVPFLVSPSGRPVVGREAVSAILNGSRQKAFRSTGTQLQSESGVVGSDLTKSANDASNDFKKNADAARSRSTTIRGNDSGRSTHQGSNRTQITDSLKIFPRREVVDCIDHSTNTENRRGEDKQDCVVNRRKAATRLAELFPLSTMVGNVTAAKVLSKKPQTLRRWASRQTGPIQSTKVAGRIMWSIADLQNLLDGSVPTS